MLIGSRVVRSKTYIPLVPIVDPTSYSLREISLVLIVTVLTSYIVTFATEPGGLKTQ